MNFFSRYLVFILVIILNVIVVYYGSTYPFIYAVLFLIGPLLVVGFYDITQNKWTVTRNYPITGHLRTFFYWVRPYLRSYIVEDDLTGTPFSYRARNLVHARARGNIDTQPFGTEQNAYDESYRWIIHSIVPEECLDKSPRVDVGNDQTKKPYSASVFNISAMSFGALSANAIEALNFGAKQGGFYHDTGEGGLSPYHLKHGGDIVWELGSGYFGARDKNGNFDPELFKDQSSVDEVKMTEIKLSQGAKPGHGGLLPAAKVTEEIARVRKVPPYEDCLSPRRHKAFSTPIEMLEFAAQMRDLSGGKPVGIKLCIGKPYEVFAIMKAILKTGIKPEFIVVDGAEGGTGAAPEELSDWVGMPLMDGLILMRNALVGTGLKSSIKLAASGKIYSGMGLAYHMALGADWCNAARAFMFSIGCIQSQRCHLDTCPTGVATQDKLRQRALVPKIQGPRAARFHGKTLEALADIIAAVGLKHPSELKPYHLMHRVGPEKSQTIDTIHTFLPEGILCEAPEDTIYADWWKVAQADSFQPAFDFHEYRVRARN
ncbi:glutamate synthase domain-containing protein 2 [Nitrosomonas sp. PY1]|uniref:FMN-binding glutamate synthase family protein n=1 Tax=Nitrosomonas sp. PY1 TaxID=1803906 RepID=UPI001FC8CB8B|nr:glutamate synthase-related protein [Nitrosomonas sp. PY1]GKS68919.1 glutamate synthase domain-containing protein 2 [Nitrosomonas sp. PY1]